MLVCKAWRHALQPLLASLLVIGNAIEASQVKALMGLSDRFVDVETVVLGQTTVHAWAAHARLLVRLVVCRAPQSSVALWLVWAALLNPLRRR